MKPSKLAIVLGITAVVGGGLAFFYRKNLRKIEKDVEKETKDYEDLGIGDIEKIQNEPINHVDPHYGNIRRFADLPVSHQVMKLLHCSTNWTDDDLDWESAVYGDKGSFNSVHVVFKEDGDQDGYPNNKVGFFIEVPPLVSREKGAINTLKYRNYLEFLGRLSNEFWEKNRVECGRPKDVECLGLYSRIVEAQGGRILKYERIPESTLKSKAYYPNDRLDGLYRYYSDAKKTFDESGIDILPDGIEDIHLFMGVWFKIECVETNTYGMSLKQILQFLEEIVINDNYVIEDYNHRNQQTLGPIVIHPRNELEIILNSELKEEPIVFE